MTDAQTNNKKKMSKRKQEIIFLCTALAFPLLQFFVMYICVNFNSILLAFKEYEDVAGSNEFIFVGFDNFAEQLDLIFNDIRYATMMKNSLTMWFFSSPVTILIAMLIAYSVWKKVYFSGFFSTMLFMPSVLSTVVFVMILRMLVPNVLPVITGDPDSGLILMTNNFTTLLVYDRLLSFGVTMIYFMGAMSAISTGLVEYGKIEGVNALQEFVHIVFPAIYPTVVSLLVVGFAQIFTNMGLLLAYHGVGADISVRTFGLHIYIQVKGQVSYHLYPDAASLGLIFTVVIVPIVFTAKYLLEKFGPRED